MSDGEDPAGRPSRERPGEGPPPATAARDEPRGAAGTSQHAAGRVGPQTGRDGDDERAQPREVSGRAWALLIVTGLVARALHLALEPAYLHPDAMFQALEPAYLLIGGPGDRAWEFEAGVRGWIWPAALAGPMALASAFGAGAPPWGMGPALAAARSVPIALDLLSLALVVRITARLGHARAALLAGGIYAAHPVFVAMGTQPLIDVPSTTLMLALTDRVLAQDPRDRSWAPTVGLLAGATVMLRVQLLPAVLVALAVAVMAGRRRPIVGAAPPGTDGLRAARTEHADVRDHALRRPGLWIGAGLAVAVAAFASVDALTWGRPGASTIDYLALQWRSGAEVFGHAPMDRYVRDAWAAFGVLAIVGVALAVLGATRSGSVAAIAAAILIPHQLVPLRAFRFIHPCLGLLVVLACLGGASLLQYAAERVATGPGGADTERQRTRSPPRVAMLVAGALAIFTARAWATGSPWETTWLYARGGWPAVEGARGLNRAALWLSAQPRPARVLQAVLPGEGAPGHALWGHDVSVIHALSEPADGPTMSPTSLAEVDVWIVGAALELPPDLRVVWQDEVTGVRVVSR